MSGIVARSWAHQVFIACDQLLNAILGGWADETLSARAYRLAFRAYTQDEITRWVYAEKVINWLFTPQDWNVKRQGLWTGARHCERAYVAEQEMKQNAPEYRPENQHESARV